MIDVNELYIVNYCHPNCVPFKNIVRLPKTEAFILAEEMAINNKNNAFGRFTDFTNYYPLRMKCDQVLYHSFISLGGKPQEMHPLSFVLQGSDYLHDWFDHGNITKIPLKDIPSEYISFTYGDSSAILERNGSVSVISIEMLLDSICSYDGTIDEYMDEICKKYYYIEVQLWNDEYIKSFLSLDIINK